MHMKAILSNIYAHGNTPYARTTALSTKYTTYMAGSCKTKSLPALMQLSRGPDWACH